MLNLTEYGIIEFLLLIDCFCFVILFRDEGFVCMFNSVKHIIFLLWAKHFEGAKNYISNIDNRNNDNDKLTFIKCLL